MNRSGRPAIPMPMRDRAVLDRFRDLAPALAVTVGLAALAMLAATVLPWALSPLVLALLAGVALANIAPEQGREASSRIGALPGVLLRVGVVLLGTRGSLEMAASVGVHALVV